MLEMPSLKPESRYGMPAADQIMFNRFFVIGYSYYFRQAKWALEIVDPIRWTDDDDTVDRLDNFRPDYRVPPMFRADLGDFRGSDMTAAISSPAPTNAIWTFKTARRSCCRTCRRKNLSSIGVFGDGSKRRCAS